MLIKYKRGDKVQVITGQHKGVKTHIARFSKGKIFLKDVNIRIKYKKTPGEKSVPEKISYPIDKSNIKLLNKVSVMIERVHSI